MIKASVLWLALSLSLPCAFGQDYADIGPGDGFPADEATLEGLRFGADAAGQRQHMWRIFSALTRAAGASHEPIFLTWYGAGEVFAGDSAAAPSPVRDLPLSLSLPVVSDASSATPGAAPLIIRAHYNRAAYRHIRANGLQSKRRLIELANVRPGSLADGAVPSIPDFPRESVVVKTVWWPVPGEGTVALPVWDAADNAPRKRGNDYLSWSRVVAVSAHRAGGATGDTAEVEFLGRRFRNVHAVDVDALYHIILDQALAESLMADPETRRTAQMVLGRPLRANDMLALVALHVATRELKDWVWGTFWWHDRPQEEGFASSRPFDLPQPWRNYLMSVAFDSDLPHEADGSPHVAFNPWLEGRFVDSGHGSGVVSNCVTCHRRASTAATLPFAVTRNVSEAPPATAGKADVRTSFLWSIPLQSR